MDREKIEKELRRNRSTLVVVGMGVIAFGAWSVVKTVLMLTLRPGLSPAAFDTDYPYSDETLMYHIFYYGFIALFLLFDLLLRLFVGLNARREGLGGKKGVAYIVLACLLAAVSLVGNTAGLITIKDGVNASVNGGYGDLVMSLLVEITATVTLIELIVAAVRVKRLERIASAQEV